MIEVTGADGSRWTVRRRWLAWPRVQTVDARVNDVLAALERNRPLGWLQDLPSMVLSAPLALLGVVLILLPILIPGIALVALPFLAVAAGGPPYVEARRTDGERIVLRVRGWRRGAAAERELADRLARPS